MTPALRIADHPHQFHAGLTVEGRGAILPPLMSTPKKPRPSANGSEARRTNVLLEALKKELSLVAEAVSGLTERSERNERRTARLETGLELITPVVKSLAPVPDELKSLADVVRKVPGDLDTLTFVSAKTTREMEAVKTELRLVRSDLTTFSKRLEAAEARPA